MLTQKTCGPHCDADFQYRFVVTLLALDMLKNMISPALWILQEKDSVLSKVASLATWPDTLAVCWLMLASCIVPYIVMQIFFLKTALYETLVRLACFSVCFSGVFWVYMGYLSRNLAYGTATLNFVFNGLASVGLGAALARGLNNQQLADRQKEQTLCAVKT